MADMFSWVIAVQLARVSTQDNTDDCQYSFVDDAMVVFGQAACLETFFTTATSMIDSGDIASAIVGFQILSDILEWVPTAIIPTVRMLPAWIPALLQNDGVAVGFKMIKRFACHQMAYLCDCNFILDCMDRISQTRTAGSDSHPGRSMNNSVEAVPNRWRLSRGFWR
jgi:hypothetical protein